MNELILLLAVLCGLVMGLIIGGGTALRREQKFGRWIPNDREIAIEYTCSKCGFTYCEAEPETPPEKYCCKCGANNE